MKKAAMPLILIAVVLLAVKVIAEAQQAKIPRIGYLTVTGPSPSQALLQGLRDLGYVVGSLFLLAVALSLRLTRVTAEVYVLKKPILANGTAEPKEPSKA